MYLQFLSWAMQLGLQIGNTIFILTQTCMSWLCWRLSSSTELPHLLSPVHLYETFKKKYYCCLFVCFSSQQFCAYLVVIRAFSQSLKPILSLQLSSLPLNPRDFLQTWDGKPLREKDLHEEWITEFWHRPHTFKLYSKIILSTRKITEPWNLDIQKTLLSSG